MPATIPLPPRTALSELVRPNFSAISRDHSRRIGSLVSVGFTLDQQTPGTWRGLPPSTGSPGVSSRNLDCQISESKFPMVCLSVLLY